MLLTLGSYLAICYLSPVSTPIFQPKNRITLEQITNSVIGSVRDCIVESDGTVVVVDSKRFNVKVFRSNGSLTQTVGRQGEGPGEFQAPRAVCHNEKWYFVSDMMRQNIQVFDKATWKYVKTIQTYDAMEIHASDTQVWITAPHLENDTSLHAYDFNGKLLLCTVNIPAITKKNKLLNW